MYNFTTISLLIRIEFIHKNNMVENIKQIRYLYQDNSLFKSSVLSEKRKNQLKLLPNRQKLLEEKSIIRRKSEERYKVQSQWEAIYKAQVTSHYNKFKRMNEAALTIQRYTRGFLSRLHTDAILLPLEENLNEKLLSSMCIQIQKVTLGIEIILLPAVLRIQQAYRRYLVRKKILLWISYLNFLSGLRIAYAEGLVSTWALTIKHRLFIYNIKFEKYRVRKLREIRRNLAILAIKGVWERYKFTFKTIKDRVLRYKRRQSLILSRDKYKLYLEAFNDTKRNEAREGRDSSLGCLDDSSEISLDAQAKNTEKLKKLVQQKIKDRVSKGKISYSVVSLKSKMILPIMGEKIMFANKNCRSDSKVFDLTDSSHFKSNIITRVAARPRRKTAIFSPVKVSTKKSSLLREDSTPPLIFHKADSNNAIYFKRRIHKSLDSINYNAANHKNYMISATRYGSRCKAHRNTSSDFKIQSKNPSYHQALSLPRGNVKILSNLY